MASRGLGSLTLDLILKMGGFEQGMDKAARLADKRMREIERRAQQFGKFLGVAVAAGATAATAAVVALTKHAIDNADAMRDLSIRIGVSTETLSAYGYAASQTGTNIDSLAKGLKILAKNAADGLNPTNEYAKVFDALGITLTDNRGKLRSLGSLIPEIADKFKAMEDGTTKAALAQALFGKSGLEMTEFLNSGAAGLEDFTEKARTLGIVIDDKTATAADAFNDTLGDLKAQAGGLGLAVADKLLPHLQRAAGDLGELVKQGNLAANIASVMGAAFQGAATLVSWYTKAVSLTTLAMENYATVARSVLEIQRNLVTFGFADGSVSGAMARIRQQKTASDAEMQDILHPKSNPFRNVTGSVSTVPVGGNRLDESAIARALSNPTSIRSRTSAVEKQIAAVQEALSLEEQWAILETEVYTPAMIEAHNKRVEAWANETGVVAESTSAMSVFAEQAGRNIQDAFSDFLFDPFDQGLKGMLESFGDTLRRMAAQAAASKLFDALGSWGNANGGSFWGSLASQFFGGKANAKGGVYSSPSLSAYSGQIVSKPTMFAFANGAGLMGEAGPEAILPLRRGRDGKLGVSGGGLSVVVNNYGNDNIRASMAPDVNGMKQLIIDVVSEDTAMGGRTARAQKQRFGLREMV